jgi:hypothetical protein
MTKRLSQKKGGRGAATVASLSPVPTDLHIGAFAGLPDLSRCNIPEPKKCTKWPQNIPKGRKIFEMDVNVSKWSQNTTNGRQTFQMVIK